MFRLNRIRPHGPGLAQERALLRRQRQAGKSGDESAWRHRRGLAWRRGRGSRQSAPPSSVLHNAIAAGLLQAAAKLDRLFAAGERPDHGAVVHALGAQVGAADGVRLAAQHARNTSTGCRDRRSARRPRFSATTPAPDSCRHPRQARQQPAPAAAAARARRRREIVLRGRRRARSLVSGLKRQRRIAGRSRGRRCRRRRFRREATRVEARGVAARGAGGSSKAGAAALEAVPLIWRDGAADIGCCAGGADATSPPWSGRIGTVRTRRGSPMALGGLSAATGCGRPWPDRGLRRCRRRRTGGRDVAATRRCGGATFVRSTGFSSRRTTCSSLPASPKRS